MNRWSSWGIALLLVAFVAVSGHAQDKDKKDAVKKDAAPKKDKDKEDKPLPIPGEKPVKTALVDGEIVHVETGKQSFRIKVPIQTRKLNEGAANGIVQAQQQMAQAQAKRPPDVNGYRAAYQSLLQHQANLVKIETTWKEHTLEATDKASVRLPAPKEVFDEMGNVKKFTKAELEKLKGKDGFFDGEFSDLTNGQIVRVTYILPMKPVKPLKKDDLLLEDNKIEATKIAILRQPKIK